MANAYTMHDQHSVLRIIGIMFAVLAAGLIIYAVASNWNSIQSAIANLTQPATQQIVIQPPPPPPPVIIEKQEGRYIENPRSATHLMRERYAESGECVDLVFMADEAAKSRGDRVINAASLQEDDIRKVIAGATRSAYGPALLIALAQLMESDAGYRFVCDEGATLFVGLAGHDQILITELIRLNGSGFILENIEGAHAFPDAFIDVFYSPTLGQFVVYTQDGAGVPNTWRFYAVDPHANKAHLIEACTIIDAPNQLSRVICAQEYTGT